MQERVAPLWRQFYQGLQGKLAQVQSWMRHAELLIFNNFFVNRQNIQINHSVLVAAA